MRPSPTPALARHATEIAQQADEIYPEIPLHLDQLGLRLLFVQPNIHGAFPENVVSLIQSVRKERNYDFLAFPPKCGGTFIRYVLGHASGAGPNPRRLGHAQGGRDATPYLPTLAAQMLSPT